MAYHYGKTIREYRMLAGLTLSQLAEKWPSKEAGVTLRYVSDIERENRKPSKKSVLLAIAEAYELDPEEVANLALYSQAYVPLDTREATEQQREVAVMLARAWPLSDSQLEEVRKVLEGDDDR